MATILLPQAVITLADYMLPWPMVALTFDQPQLIYKYGGHWQR